MRVLVTGGAGFIGGHFCRLLVDSGFVVTTVDDLSSGMVGNVPDGVEFIEADCSSAQIFKVLETRRFDVVFHLAGQSSGERSFGNPNDDFFRNVVSTLNCLKLCEEKGIDRFVYASSMAVYGEQAGLCSEGDTPLRPESFYALGKECAERYIQKYQTKHMKTTIYRFFNVYGPGQDLANMQQGMVSIYLAQLLYEPGNIVEVKGRLDRTRDFVFYKDVVNVLLNTLSNSKTENQVINIGTGQATTVCGLLDIFAELTGRSFSIVTSDATPFDIDHSCADTTKLFDIFQGLESEMTPLREGLREMWLSYSGQAK